MKGSQGLCLSQQRAEGGTAVVCKCPTEVLGRESAAVVLARERHESVMSKCQPQVRRTCPNLRRKKLWKSCSMGTSGGGKKILYRNLGDVGKGMTEPGPVTAEQSPRTAPALEFKLSALTFLHCSGILRRTLLLHTAETTLVSRHCCSTNNSSH